MRKAIFVRFLLALCAGLFAATSVSAQVSINTTLTTGTMSGSLANAYRTAYLHFQLVNCGDNIPVIPGQPSAVAQDAFDLYPSAPGSAVIGSILGNDQMTCGNVVSTYYVVSVMKDASHPLRGGIPYVICSASSTLGTCSNQASLGAFNLVTADPMSAPPPAPGFSQLYENPSNSQTWTQPLGTVGNFLGSFDFVNGIYVGSTLVADLPALVGLSNVIYVSDGTAGSVPCVGGGTGAWAFYQGSIWTCALGSSGGTGPTPGVFSVTPTTINFGNIALGSTSGPTISTLTNNSASSVTGISTSLTSTQAADFLTVLSSTCGTQPFSLAAGQNCSFNNQFKPSLNSTETATLTVSSSAGPSTINLSGTGFGTGALTITPGSLAFGSLPVGQGSQPMSISIQNLSSATVGNLSLSASPSQYAVISNTCPSILGPLGSCAVSVSYTPSAVSSQPGTLTISSNSPGSPSVIALSGSGSAAVVTLNSVAISPTNPSCTLPCTQQYTVTGTLSTGGTQNLTNAVRYNVPAGSNPSFSRVNQSIANCDSGTSTCASHGSGVTMTSGDTVLVFHSIANLATASNAPTDTLGSTYNKITTQAYGSISLTAWYAILASTGSNTVTCNENGSLDPNQVCAYQEISGAAASGVIDTSSVSNQPGTATTSVTVPTFTTTNTDYVACFTSDTSSTGIPTAGAGYTMVQTQTSYYSGDEEQVNASAGHFSCPFTNAKSDTSWIAVGVALLPGTSASTCTVNSAGLVVAQGTGSCAVTANAADFDLGQIANSPIVGASTTSISAAYLNAQMSGYLNIVFAQWDNSTAPTITIADSVGNTYHLCANNPINGTGVSQTCYYSSPITAAAANANTVTVSFGTAVINPRLEILSVPGLTGTVDASTSSAGSSTSCGTAVTTTVTGDYIVSACGVVSTGASNLGSVTAPFIQRVNVADPSPGDSTIADNSSLNNSSMFAAAGAQTPVTSVSPSGQWVSSTLAMKTVNTNTTQTISSGSVNNFWVDPVNGLDTNPGTQASPWKTICKADSALTLGTNGTIVNLLPGQYDTTNQLGPGAPCAVTNAQGNLVLTTTHNGTSSQRIKFSGPTRYGVNGVRILGAWYTYGTFVDIWNGELTGANNVTGFNIGINDVNNATTANSSTVRFFHVHDIATSCSTTGGVAQDQGAGISVASRVQNVTIDSNIVRNIGVPGGCAGQKGNGPHGIYISGPHNSVTNNLVSNAAGHGLEFYHNVCNENANGNDIIHNYGVGIEVAGWDGNAANSECNAGNNFTAVNQNLVVDNAYGCGVIVSGANAGPAAGAEFYNTGTGTTSNQFAFNMLANNWGGGGAGCTQNPGNSNTLQLLAGSPAPVAATNYSQSTNVGLVSTFGDDVLPSFNPPNLGGTSNFSPIVNGPLWGTGSPNEDSCAASPGFTVCAPTNDLPGVIRSTTKGSVGAYECSGAANQVGQCPP